MRKSARVFVPASSGNVGPGFDVVGMALGLGNELRLSVLSLKAKKPVISLSGEGADSLPLDTRNIVYQAAKKVFSKANKKVPALKFECKNRIPLARGLGSSASAILSGMLAANRLLNNRFSKEQILNWATQMEGHPDNLAPALYGGIQVAGFVNGGLMTNAWPIPRVSAVVAIPHFRLSTKKARQILPKNVSMKDAVHNLSRVALLPLAFAKDSSLLKDLLIDRLHENYRAKLIPGFHSVRKQAMKAGALSVTLSGAGPSMLSLVEHGKAKKVGHAMKAAFAKNRVHAEIKILRIQKKGSIVK